MTLFEIDNDLRDFESALEALTDLTEGEVTDEQTEQLFNEFFANIGELKQVRDRKLDNYAWLIREREAKANARAEEAARMQALAQADLNFAARLKKRLQRYFEANGIQKHETLHFKFGVQKNGGVLPLMIADNLKPEDLPENFRVVRLEFNNEAIRKALSDGEQIEGVSLGERGQHLRIR